MFSLFTDSRISCIPENETEPFFQMRFNASEVSLCAACIASISVMGVSSRHISLAMPEEACSSNRLITLLYSSVFNAFAFIEFTLYSSTFLYHIFGFAFKGILHYNIKYINVLCEMEVGFCEGERRQGEKGI